MEVLAKCSKLQLCPCYKECQEFQKLVELKDYGLVIYIHRTCTDNIRQGEAIGSAVNTSSDVFILHNKKDVKVTTSQLTSELEKENISCPRCRKRFQHAQELMKEVKSLDRRIVMGICEHCRNRALVSKKPYCACEQIVKLFKTVKGEQTEDTKKYVKVLPSKTGDLRTDKQKEIRAYSDLKTNRDLKSPAAGHEPEVHQMFFSDTHFQSDDTEMSETESKESYIKQAAAFIEPIKPMETSFVSTTHDDEKINNTIPGISLEGSVTTFVKSYVGVKELPRPSINNRKEKEIFEDISLMNAKEELKRRHDLSLRQMVKLEKDSGVPISISKRPDAYSYTVEKPKIAPWEKKQPTPKSGVVGSETQIKKIPSRTKHELGPTDPDYVSNKLSKFESPRKKKNLQGSDIEPSKLDKEGSGEGAKNVKNLEDPYFVKNVKLGRNVKTLEQRVTKSKSKPVASVGSVINPQFSYFFPKGKEKKVKHSVAVRSSELIKDTQEKYKKRKEQKRQQNKEQEQKKQLGRKERKLQDVEKIIYMDEQQMLSQRDNSKEITVEKKDAKKDKKSKPVQKVNDAVEEKSRPGEKVEGAAKKKQLKTEDEEGKLSIVEEEKLETEKGEKLKPKKGERDGKLQRDQQVGKEILKQAEKLRNKKLQTEKDKSKEEKRIKEKEASEKTGKSIKKKLKSSDDIKMSNIDKSISEEAEVEEMVSIKKKKGGKISTKKESPIARKQREEFKRLQAEYLKAKALKQKLLLDAQKAKQEAEFKELKTTKKRIKQARSGDYLKLVKIKQTSKITPFDIPNVLLKAHTAQHKRGKKLSTCPLCLDSELELDVLSIHKEINLKKDKIKNIIIGEKICKYKPGLEKTNKPQGVVPIFFQKDVFLESDFQKNIQIIPQEAEAVQKKILATDVSKKDEIDTETGIGITRYALSDRTFIDKGWTVLPTEKVVRMMNVYRMRPAHPEFDWFKHNKTKRLMTYDTGERLAEFDDNGRGRWYYRSGRLALDYYDAEEINAQQRFVIYSSGEPDERGRTHPITILATFDYLGNGIVFDHTGKIRLKYNQTEGVVLDRAIGPVSHWKWHTLNDPPVLQQVMIDTQVAHKDPDILKLGLSADVVTRPDNEDMLAIEFDNFIKEKSKKLSQKLVPFQIKMKALKINEHFSLKVLDQATVYLIFRDGLTNLKVNMGMILDEKEIVDTDTAEVGEVSNSLERFPARTDSLAGLQRSVAHARLYEKQHAERERRLRPPEPCASADLITAAASMPMRLPLRTVPTGSLSTTRYCSRKPSNNLYYDTRLLC